MRSLSRLGILLVALLSLSVSSVAQPGEAPVAFRHVGMESGLTHERVSSVCSGVKGFLWLSTLWGIDCYDGNAVTSFSMPDSVLRGGEVLGAQEFGSDTMLIRTSAGLALFMRSKLTFARADDFLRSRGATDEVRDVWTDGLRNLWMLGESTVFFSPSGGGSCSFALPDEVGVSCVSRSRYGFAVLLTDGRVVRCSPPAPGCAPSPQVFTTPIPSGGRLMKTDVYGDIWVISQNGDSLWHKPVEGAGWELLNDQPYWGPDVPSDLVDIAVDPRRRVWLVSEQSGACIIDPSSGTATPLKRDPSSPFSLRSNICTCVKAFGSGTIVIGYQHSGFSIYHPAAFKFSPLQLSPSSLQTALSDVRSFASDGHGSVYVGANVGGVLKVDIATHKAVRVPFAESEAVERLVSLPDGSLWAFVSGKGFVRYHEGQGGPSLTYFADMSDAPDPLSGNVTAGSLAGASDGSLWAASARQLLALPNAASEGDMFNGCAAANLDDEVVTMRTAADSASVLILTRSSFFKARLNGGRVEITKLSDHDLRAERPSDICQGIRGFIWVATTRGVAVFAAPDSSGYARFLQNIELSQPAVSLAPCQQGGALAATSSEVCLFKVFRNGGNYRFVTGRYNVSSGLLPGVNSPRTALTLPTGEVWIGSEGGVNIYTSRLDDDSTVPMVSFSTLMYNGSIVLPGQEIGGVVPIDRAVPLCNSITLPSGYGYFALNLSVLGAPSAKCYSYLCEILGSDIPPTTSLEPYFIIPDLGGGTYTLRVTAIDPEGRRSESAAELTINFYVPWTSSPWLRLIIVALIAASVCTGVVLLFLRHYKKIGRSATSADFGEQTSDPTDIESVVLKSVAANVATSIDVLADDIRAVSDTRGLPLTDSIAIRNMTYRLISANSALAAVAGSPISAGVEGASHTSRHDIVAAARTTVRQIANITHTSQTVGFSSPLRNCVFNFDAEAFRSVLIDVVVDAIVSTAGQGFVRVLVEKGKYGADLVSISVCIGGELPSSSLYFNAGGEDPALPFNVEACLHRLKATAKSADFGDGMLYTFIHIPIGG